MKPELLSPCHDFATLKTAIKSGADAVYFGVKDYNMRAKAGNFNLKDLPLITKECHNKGVRAYLTVNVVVYEKELSDIQTILVNARNAGIDAVIVHDIAVLKLAKALGLECHVSTQANISNSVEANAYADLGADRVILSRELNLNQIKEIIKNSRVPVEVFVHGAMCVSISGRCFLSQMIYGQNANRGECYQPCRQEWRVSNEDGELIYDGERFLNAKDLCMIEHLPELIDSGIASLKIEGRMRDANYVSTVTNCYREAIDDFNEERIPHWLEQLKSVFNRGFCTGFYYNQPEENHEQSNNQSKIKKEFIGLVTNYYDKIGVAEVSLTAGSLSKNDEIIIESSNDFLKQKINSMEVNHESISKANKGMRIGLEVNESVRKRASIYKLVKLKE